MLSTVVPELGQVLIAFCRAGKEGLRPGTYETEGSEVDIWRDTVTGEVVLSAPKRSWDEYFDWVRALDLPDDFLQNPD